MNAIKHIIIGIAYCILATIIVVNVIDLSWFIPPSWDYLTPLQ